MELIIQYSIPKFIPKFSSKFVLESRSNVTYKTYNGLEH